MYAEDLPALCPPHNAVDKAMPKVYRLIRTNEVSEESFYSKAKLKEQNRSNAADCIFASCSLVLDHLAQIKKWPRMRETYPYAAEMSIPFGAGKSDGKKYSNHINFWPFKSSDLMAMVTNVIELPEVVDNE
jgi:hypothetical protein